MKVTLRPPEGGLAGGLNLNENHSFGPNLRISLDSVVAASEPIVTLGIRDIHTAFLEAFLMRMIQKSPLS